MLHGARKLRVPDDFGRRRVQLSNGEGLYVEEKGQPLPRDVTFTVSVSCECKETMGEYVWGLIKVFCSLPFLLVTSAIDNLILAVVTGLVDIMLSIQNWLPPPYQIYVDANVVFQASWTRPCTSALLLVVGCLPYYATYPQHEGAMEMMLPTIKNLLDVFYLQKFNACVGFLHFLQFCIVLGVALDRLQRSIADETELGDIISCWSFVNGTSEETATGLRITNTVYGDGGVGGRIRFIAWCIVVFFGLSALFQLGRLLFDMGGERFVNPRAAALKYRENVSRDRPQAARYLEYALSASTMAMAIVASFGVVEKFILVAVFFLTFGCMVLGLAADALRYVWVTYPCAISRAPDAAELPWYIRTMHGASWVLFTVPWVWLYFLYGTFNDSDLQGAACGYDRLRLDDTMNNTTGSVEVPWFVQMILFGQFFLFLCFGQVQRRQFLRYGVLKTPPLVKDGHKYGGVQQYALVPNNSESTVQDIGLFTEFDFITLSLTAKTFLAWVVFSQVIVEQTN